jgi:hypothetical protein
MEVILLDFLDDHVLLSKEINEQSGDDENLKLEGMPSMYKIFKTKKQYPVSVMHWACWKVARTDVKSQKRLSSACTGIE